MLYTVMHDVDFYELKSGVCHIDSFIALHVLGLKRSDENKHQMQRYFVILVKEKRAKNV